MTRIFRKIGACMVSSALSVMPLSALMVPSFAHADTNLITNGSLDAHTVATTTPDFWQQGGYDGASTPSFATKTSFSYVEGRTATSSESLDKAVAVTVLASLSGGDAKWLPVNTTPVSTGKFYSFSDWYKTDANTNSYLIVEYTHSGGAIDYHPLATLDPTGGVWVETVQDFDVPTDVVAIRVFHLINAPGTLTTDDYTLTEVAGNASYGGFPTGIVTLTFDDGWASQYENAFPKLQAAGLKGTFYIMSTSTIAASHDLYTETTQDIQTTVTTDGTVWSNIYRDPTTLKYWFSDTYEGAASQVVVTYTPLGSTEATTTIATLGMTPSGVAQTSGVVLNLPATEPNTPISIAHKAVNPADTFSATGASLTVYGGGYMNVAQLKNLLGAGNEIGNHTEDHCSLSRILAGDASICAFAPALGATANSEVANAQSALSSLLSTTLSALAYPFGEYNSGVKSVLASNGLTSARTVDAGYNRITSDQFALKGQTVDVHTTLDMVKGWVKTAKDNHLWLILIFHQVDDPTVLTSNGETGGVPTDTFNSIIEYLQGESANVNFLTVHDALAFMTPAATPDTTAPVITLTGDAVVNLTVGDTYTEAGATAHDNKDGDITSSIVISGKVTTAETETSTVHYNVKDAAGNSAVEVTRTIVVHAATHTPETGSSGAPASGSTGGGGGGGNGPIFTPALSSGAPSLGVVLGLSTTTVSSSTAACTDLLVRNLSYMGKGNAKDDVKALQTFLNTHAGEKLPVSGIFAALTRAAVHRFQTAHAGEILTPAHLSKSTGLVGYMTRKSINQIYCTGNL